MRIAFIYDAVYPWVKGGAEKRVYEIAKRLVKRGHEVSWFGLKWWDGREDLERDGIILHGIGKQRSLYVNGRRSIREALYFGLKVLIKLKGDFDVMDCQEFPYFSCFSAKLRSKFNNSKLLITWHEIWENYWFDYLGRIGVFGQIVERLTAKLPHTAITISEKIRNNLKVLGVPEDRIRVIPNGVDFYQLQKIKASEKSFDIIYVGRLVPHKNVDVLLKAIAEVKKEIPDIKCCIIGDGPQKPYLRALSKRLGIEGNVVFLGFIGSDEEAYSYMKSSKLFVLPSTREGFGMTVLESNSCGLPSITVKHRMNGAVELVKDGYNGYVVSLSPYEIAEKIVCLLQDEDELKRLSKNAVEFARNYDWDVIVDMIEEVYSSHLCKHFLKRGSGGGSCR